MQPSGSDSYSITKAERDVLISRHREARAAYNQAMDEHAAALDSPAEIGIDESSDAYVDTPAYRRARSAIAEMTGIEEEYFRQLPRLAMAPCPYCENPLFRTFDPFGLDGLWWRSDAQPEEPTPCPHFCVLQGAVNLGGSWPCPDFDVHPGPGAPFVIPRLLDHQGMVAVISEIHMVDGPQAHPVAYFAPRRPPVQTLAVSWARTNFLYTTQLGVHAWRRADELEGSSGTDVWDFAIEPWLARAKVRWCDPGSDRTLLSTAPVAQCPYVNLPGERRPQLIVGGGAPGYRDSLGV